MMPQLKTLPETYQMIFFHEFERPWEENMRLRQPTPQRESAKLRRSQMIPDPECGQTRARKRTPRSQGELRLQYRDQKTSR